MSKRSSARMRIGRYAKPTLQGVLIAGMAASLAGCEEPEPAVAIPNDEFGYVSLLGAENPEASISAFDNVEQCAADGEHSREECNEAFESANANNGSWAPQYASTEDCQTDYEDCRPRSSGGGFSPFLQGFLIGRMLDGNRGSYAPLYRSRDGSYVNGGGYGVPRLGTYPASATGLSGMTRPPVAIQRMGLGQTMRGQGVPGSRTSMGKLASSTSLSTGSREVPAWGSNKTSGWNQATNLSTRSSYVSSAKASGSSSYKVNGQSFGTSRGGFGGSGRGGGG